MQQIPRSGISQPEGGGLGGESPEGESPGEFPAELGGREDISRSTGMAERPTRNGTAPLEGGFQTAASEACGVAARGGGSKADQAGISRTSSPGILAREPKDSVWPEASPWWWGGA